MDINLVKSFELSDIFEIYGGVIQPTKILIETPYTQMPFQSYVMKFNKPWDRLSILSSIDREKYLFRIDNTSIIHNFNTFDKRFIKERHVQEHFDLIIETIKSSLKQDFHYQYRNYLGDEKDYDYYQIIMMMMYSITRDRPDMMPSEQKIKDLAEYGRTLITVRQLFNL